MTPDSAKLKISAQNICQTKKKAYLCARYYEIAAIIQINN